MSEIEHEKIFGVKQLECLEDHFGWGREEDKIISIFHKVHQEAKTSRAYIGNMTQVNDEIIVPSDDKVMDPVLKFKDGLLIERAAEEEYEDLLSSVVVVPCMKIYEFQYFFLECHRQKIL